MSKSPTKKKDRSSSQWKLSCKFGAIAYETKSCKNSGCRYSFHKSSSNQLCTIEYDGSFSEQRSLHFVFTSEMWVFAQYRKSIETLSNSKTLANLLLVICAAIEIGLLYFIGIVSGKLVPFNQ